MRTDMFARLRRFMRGDSVAASGGNGVIVTSSVTRKDRGVTPITSVTSKNDEKAKGSAELGTASPVIPEIEDAESLPNEPASPPIVSPSHILTHGRD